MRTSIRTCPLCEATCGLRLHLDGDVVTRVEGDADDVFSRGYLCPKGARIADLHDDPDRVTRPRVRREGHLVEVGWDEAFEEVASRLGPLVAAHGPDAVAVYLGNPNVHNLAGQLYVRPLLKALRTKNVFSASSVDQLPKHLSSGWLFGDPLAIPVPDVDRTDLLVVLGGNPRVSNGSLWTAPDLPGRLDALRARGGRLVVADHCGVAADVIGGLARDLAAADRAVVYGRLGTTTVRHGTVASWLVDVVNVLTGNLDRPGGAMFPKPAHHRFPRRPFAAGRWHSRVRGLPEVIGELPVATLADEIETPGEGQVRALVVVAGNPVLSTPDGGRLDAALASLDLVIAIDPYVTATSRRADVLLPPPSVLERSHYDLAFTGLAVRNIVNYSPPTFTPAPHRLDEWQILLGLAAIALGQRPPLDLEGADAFVARLLADQLVADPTARLAVRDADAVLAATGNRSGPERLLDLLLRAGPYGDGFGASPDGLGLATLEEQPHGIDLGPLEPRLPEVLATASGRIEIVPDGLRPGVEALGAVLTTPPAEGLVLVGRRHLRTNNSWSHNLPRLNAGGLCTVQMHPDDAAARGLADGDRSRVRSRVGEVEVVIEVTDDLRPGVVSLPHGFGHDLEGVELAVARAGATTDELPQDVDALVVGGGPAGSAAATWLGRYRRRTLLVDAGEPRNRAVEQVNGLPGLDPIDPMELQDRMRQGLARYPHLTRVSGRVADIRRIADPREPGPAFRATLDDGRQLLARRVVLATGVRDTRPDLEGFDEHYGADVFHCPSCEGFDARDRHVIVLGWGPHVPAFATNLLDWATSVTVVTDGPELAVSTEQEDACARLGIEFVADDPAQALLGSRGAMEGVRLASGRVLRAGMLFFSIAHDADHSLANALGCAIDDDGVLVVDHEQTTTAPGVYAAGDLTPGIQLVAAAIGQGTVAGVACARSLHGQPGSPDAPEPAPRAEDVSPSTERPGEAPEQAD